MSSGIGIGQLSLWPTNVPLGASWTSWSASATGTGGYQTVATVGAGKKIYVFGIGCEDTSGVSLATPADVVIAKSTLTLTSTSVPIYAYTATQNIRAVVPAGKQYSLFGIEVTL